MSAQMLVRATSLGLFDKPPHFALSRSYNLIARGVVESLLDPSITRLLVTYTGQPAIGIATAGPTSGFTGLDVERFWPLIQTASGFFGPFSLPFFYGLGGIVEHIIPNVLLFDPLVPVGNGTGILAPGGVVFDGDACFENMHSEAVSEQIMVVRLVEHVPTPIDTVEDPITSEELELGDLFSRPEILLRAIGAQLTVELLLATRAGIVPTGAFNPLSPPLTGVTLTTLLQLPV